MARRGAAEVPFYRRKYSRDKYLEMGVPENLTSPMLPTTLDRWIPVSEEEMNNWEDSRGVVLGKNKKREFCLTPNSVDNALPILNSNGNYELTIEVLHVDHRGFVYTDEDANELVLNRRFWPTVIKLLAHFCSPRLNHAPN